LQNLGDSFDDLPLLTGTATYPIIQLNCYISEVQCYAILE